MKTSAPKAERITPGEVRRLVSETSTVRAPELTESSGSIVYILSDGRVLSTPYEGASGLLYPSAAAFRELIGPAHPAVQHVLAEHPLPHGQEFPAHARDLALLLPEALGVDDTALDFSASSLRVVDEALKRAGRTQALSDNVFPSLVAYFGEVLRREANGRWDQRFNEEHGVWEPWIVAENREVPVFFDVYDELYERGERLRGLSLRGLLAARVESGPTFFDEIKPPPGVVGETP